MKIIQSCVALVLGAVIAAGCSASAQPETETAHDLSNATIVLLNFQALPGQEATLRNELVALIDSVRYEPNYINISMHVDPEDAGRIMMYETWADGDYYRGPHMETSYLQDFMARSRDFLAGPPEITFWNKIHSFDPHP